MHPIEKIIFGTSICLALIIIGTIVATFPV